RHDGRSAGRGAAPGGGAACGHGGAMSDGPSEEGGVDPSTGVCSCGDHLDLRAVPPGVWRGRLARAPAQPAPHGETREGEAVWVCEDGVLGGSGLPARSGALRNLSAIGRAGIDDDGFRAGDPTLRLQDMDLDGLWASVIYGPLALGLPIGDPALPV